MNLNNIVNNNNYLIGKYVMKDQIYIINFGLKYFCSIFLLFFDKFTTINTNYYIVLI
jgi:hypothetical protein